MDQNRLERQVEQSPLSLEPRILEVLPAGARPRETAITPLPWIQQQNCCHYRTPLAVFAPMNSVAAAHMAMDLVELLMIAHNLRTDRCTDH